MIATMIYTLGYVDAAIKMRVEDHYTQGRRGWMRLHEKGGKRHEISSNHNLETYIDEYIAAAGIADDPKRVPVSDYQGKDPIPNDQHDGVGRCIPNDPPEILCGEYQGRRGQSRVSSSRNHSIP